MNVPNLLTLLRLALLPVIIVLFRSGCYGSAALLFFLAMLSDGLDGWLARRLDQQTTLGLYLDPVADKILVIALLYELAHADVIGASLPHLFLAREFLQNAVRAVAAVRGSVVGANWMGKAKAAGQTVIITTGLALPGLSGTNGRAGLVLELATWALLIMTWGFFGVFAYRNRTAINGPIQNA